MNHEEKGEYQWQEAYAKRGVISSSRRHLFETGNDSKTDLKSQSAAYLKNEEKW